MVIIGQAADYTNNSNYRKEFYAKGCEKIKEFPLLHSILGNFDGFREDSYSHNVFLNIAARAHSDAFMDNKPDMQASQRLYMYEQILKEIDINSYPKKKRRSIITKMKSFESEQSESISQELEFYAVLSDIPHVKKILYDNITGSNHDFRFIIQDTTYNIELARLGESEFTKLMRKGLTKAAQMIIQKIPENHLVRFEIKTEKIIATCQCAGKLNEKKVIAHMVESVQKILPLALVAKNNFFFLDNLGSPKKTLYELKDVFHWFGEFGERLQLLLSSSDGLEYLKNTRSEEIAENPVSSVLNGDFRGRLVEIHTVCFYPSESELMRKNSLIRQLKQVVKTKLEKNQLQYQQNALIAVQFFEPVLFRSYGSKHIRQNGDSELVSAVQEAFKESSNQSISGVILYERNLTESLIIENPNITTRNISLTRLRELLRD